MGSCVSPIHIKNWLTTPWSAKMPFHAYTRSKNEVQNGSITIISKMGRVAGLARAMK